LIVTPVDDAQVEASETVVVTLAAGAGYTIGTPATATVTIADNDQQSQFNLADLTLLGVIATPTNPAAGQPVLFSATVKNQGATATPANTSLAVVFYVNGAMTSWNMQPQIAAGQMVTFTASDGFAGSNWMATAGTNVVLAVVDDVNHIGEVVQTNNSKALTLVVGATNSVAGPKVKLHPAGNGQMAVSWDSVAGKVYQVGYKNALSDPTWMPLGPQITATDTNTSYADTPPAVSNQRFYNVQIK
jgi:hypothetical protein